MQTAAPALPLAFTGEQDLTPAQRSAGRGYARFLLTQEISSPAWPWQVWHVAGECWTSPDPKAHPEHHAAMAAFDAHLQDQLSRLGLRKAPVEPPSLPSRSQGPAESGPARPATALQAAGAGPVQGPRPPHQRPAQLALLHPSGLPAVPAFGALNAVRALQKGLRHLVAAVAAGRYDAPPRGGYVQQGTTFSGADGAGLSAGGPQNDGKKRRLSHADFGHPHPDGEIWPCAQPQPPCEVGRWNTLVCRGPSQHRAHIWTGCARLDCERCAESATNKRARRVWKRIGGIHAPWAVLTLTMPPAVRHHLHHPTQLREWSKRAWEAVECWARATWGVGSMGAALWWHPVGSRHVCRECGKTLKQQSHETEEAKARATPTCCGRVMGSEDDSAWHPHANFLMPLVDVDTGTRLKPYVAKQRLDQLRAAWRLAISDLTGVMLPDVNVFYEYRSGAKKKRHALRYFGRSFPAWAGWTAKTRWFGALSGRTWAVTRHRLEVAGHFSGESARLNAVCRECAADMILLFSGEPVDWGTGPPTTKHACGHAHGGG